MLDRGELRAAATGPTFIERASLPGIEGQVRMLAAPVDVGGGTVIVGRRLLARRPRRGARRPRAGCLLIGGPIALLLASLAGYWMAGAALRPVETMRRRAAEISAAEPGARLPVPGPTTSSRRLGETLNEMLARLEAALERERRFVDDASHELRTPLALHRIELELALRCTPPTRSELRAAIASAIEEIDRLIELAEQLLVVARSEDGELARRAGAVRGRGRAGGDRRPLRAPAPDAPGAR